ncbi:hypothetical protein HYALB_00010864 [Hymenoscyphus albidus]|uniref:Uncharacterized protein n=1 Tax=Hymenoscyphus albidus TaxID=595503 RepID=A0A9N9LIQ3_9HELO|nr:hypothetical protein HYALB_00010864 [Hymenoscyphus albidus]
MSSPAPPPPMPSIREEIYRRALLKGISKEEVTRVFGQKVKDVRGLLHGRSHLSNLQRAEYFVWAHFFQDEPFPGKIDPAAAAAAATLLSPSSPSSSSPAPLGQTQLQQLAESTGSARMDLLFSSSPVDVVERRGSGGVPWVHDKYRDLPRQREADRYRPERPASRSDRQSEVVPPPVRLEAAKARPADMSKELFRVQEDILQSEVLALGHKRSEFFIYLQDARMQARNEHPNCSQAVKHYLANSAVWREFVGGKYPGSAPDPQEHSTTCLLDRAPDQFLDMSSFRFAHQQVRSNHPTPRAIKESMKVAAEVSVKAPFIHPDRAPIISSANPSSRSSAFPSESGPVDDRADNTELTARAAVSVQEPKVAKPAQIQPPQGYLIVQGKLIPCRLEDIKNVTYAWMTDCHRGVVEESLGCKFAVIQRTPDSGFRLNVVAAEPHSSSVVEKNGIKFLNKWVEHILGGDAVQMSVYWTFHAQAHGLANSTVETNYGSSARLVSDPLKADSRANSTPVTSDCGSSAPQSPAPIKSATGANNTPIGTKHGPPVFRPVAPMQEDTGGDITPAGTKYGSSPLASSSMKAMKAATGANGTANYGTSAPTSSALGKSATGANDTPVGPRRFNNTTTSLNTSNKTVVKKSESENEFSEEEYESDVEIYCGEPSVSTWKLGEKRKADDDKKYGQAEKKQKVD